MLLTLVVIYTASSKLLGQMVEDGDRLTVFTGLRLINQDEGENKVLAEAKKEIESSLTSASVRQSDRARMTACMLHIGRGDYWPPEEVAATANLLQLSPVMTGLEAQLALEQATPTPPTPASWLEGFARDQDRAIPDVRRSFSTS